ncbi:hypothetical protein ABT301_36695 [Streptomyces sp. NPDC000987]|uniref:hypothetical protein n=1 Tax=Streptomyces sp. NPDC000987 TaxID=3154374 RepID=UPI00331D3BE0
MALAAPTLIEQQAGLLSELDEVLKRHAVAGAFRLVYAPQGLDLAEGEVLVQVVSPERRVMELHPRPLADLADRDVLHETQTVDCSDGFFRDYPRQARASDCHSSTRPDGSKSHLYVM